MTRKTFQYPGLQPNARYAIQIRGIDNEGNPGRWSTSFEFESIRDEMPPAAVSNFTLDVDGADFVLAWETPTTNEDGSELDDLRDFVIVIQTGAQSKQYFTVDEGMVFSFNMNKNSFVIPQPSITASVYARDRVGNLSAAATLAASNPPPTSPVLAASAKRNAIELMWTNAFEDDGKHYEIWKNGLKYAEVAAGTTVWTDTDVGSGPQTYFIRAVDLFDQTADSNEQIEGEITLEFDSDEIPPKPPTNLQTESELGAPGERRALVTVSWDAPVEDTDDTSYTDQEGFDVRYRIDNSRPWNYVKVPDSREDGSVAQNVELEITRIVPGATLYWEVRAYDRSLNYSEWAVATHGVIEDTIPPDAPTGLEVSGGIRTIIAGWDANDEQDLAGYRVYGSTTTPVAIDPENLKFDGLGTSTSWSAGEEETWYVIVVAYDRAGNVSAPSPEQSAQTLSFVVDDTPPSDVSGLTLSASFYYHGSTQFARIVATWSPSTDDSGIFGYVLAWQRMDQGVLDPDGWTEEIIADRTRYTLTGVDLVDENPDEDIGDEEENRLQSAQYAFRVKAIDNYNNRSADWSPIEYITLDKDGDTPRGEVVREVPVTFDGAIQSDNFINLLRGFRLSENTLEIYGDESHDVSILLGRGGEGLNLSTINDQMWFGSEDFEFATWRVGEGGDMRVGGPGAFGERILHIAEQFAIDGLGDYRAHYDDTSTPTAEFTGDLWANDVAIFRWDGTSWVDIENPILRLQLQRTIENTVGTTGSLLFTLGVTEPATPSQHDVWFNDPDLYYYDGVEWTNLLDRGGFYAAASGDVWSGDPDFFEAPWSLSRHGRASFRNIRIAPDEIPVGSDLLYISTDSDAPLMVIRREDENDWNFRVGMDMFIDDGGDLQLAGGNLSLTEGNITLGDKAVFEMFGGELNLTGTPVTLNGSDFTVVSGNIIVDETGSALDINPTGIIKSADYNYSERTGWALDGGNLYLFSGEVDANLVTVQNQQNLLEYGYTTIPYRPDWYAMHLQTDGLVASVTGLWSRYGPNGLRLFGDTNDTVEMYEQIGGSPDYAKIKVSPGERYIYSAYVYNNAATVKNMQLYIVESDFNTINSDVFTVEPGEFKRVHMLAEITPGNNGAYVAMRLLSDGADFIVDGLQFEQRTNSDEPGRFNIGGSTRIDADSIQTGSITSNNYLEGQSGFKIAMDGSVEFQGGIFRGQLFAEDFVSGTIENQNFVLSTIERFVVDHEFANEWADVEILSRSLA